MTPFISVLVVGSHTDVELQGHEAEGGGHGGLVGQCGPHAQAEEVDQGVEEERLVGGHSGQDDEEGNQGRVDLSPLGAEVDQAGQGQVVDLKENRQKSY